jgi:hypothetical protein
MAKKQPTCASFGGDPQPLAGRRGRVIRQGCTARSVRRQTSPHVRRSAKSPGNTSGCDVDLGDAIPDHISQPATGHARLDTRPTASAISRSRGAWGVGPRPCPPAARCPGPPVPCGIRASKKKKRHGLAASDQHHLSPWAISGKKLSAPSRGAAPCSGSRQCCPGSGRPDAENTLRPCRRAAGMMSWCWA